MLSTSLLLTVAVGAASVLASKHERRDLAKVTYHHELEERAEACPPDHTDWEYLNAGTWWQQDPTQQDHARFHAYLSMAAYGDYATECPKTFNGTDGFTVLQSFSASGSPYGQSGYIAKVPSMQKIIIVFQGNSMSGVDFTPETIEDLVDDCSGCTVAKGVKELYLLAKSATNGFEVATAAVKSTGLLYSVTGHGLGGCVAALAGLDLGSKNLVHYAHNQGMPRCFSYEAIVRYDNLFQALAGQSIVNRDDPVPLSVAEGTYCHVGTKVHITGPVDQWLTNCYGWNENTTCLGTGSTESDHTYYWTPIGECGSANKGF